MHLLLRKKYGSPICFADRCRHWSEKESHLDGLRYSCQGVDRSGLLSILCQPGNHVPRSALTPPGPEHSTSKDSETVIFSFQILRTYKTDPKMGEMIRNVDFYVTPVLNMDGYIYSWKDNSVSDPVLGTISTLPSHGLRKALNEVENQPLVNTNGQPLNPKLRTRILLSTSQQSIASH